MYPCTARTTSTAVIPDPWALGVQRVARTSSGRRLLVASSQGRGWSAMRGRHLARILRSDLLLQSRSQKCEPASQRSSGHAEMPCFMPRLGRLPNV